MSKAEKILQAMPHGKFWVLSHEIDHWTLLIYKDPHTDPTVYAEVHVTDEQAQLIERIMKGQDNGETPTR